MFEKALSVLFLNTVLADLENATVPAQRQVNVTPKQFSYRKYKYITAERSIYGQSIIEMPYRKMHICARYPRG